MSEIKFITRDGFIRTQGGNTFSLKARIEGSYVVAGTTLFKFDMVTGAEDTTFSANVGNISPMQILKMVVQTGGKLVCVGNFNAYNGTSVGRIMRINTDGTLDTSFNSGGSGFDLKAKDIVQMDDGTLVVTGDFTSYNGIARSRIVFLDPDGNVDTTLTGNQPNFGVFTSSIDNVAIDNQGRIVYAARGGATSVDSNGETFQFSSSGWGTVFRYNPDGTHDLSFNNNRINGYTQNSYRGMAIDNNDNIYVVTEGLYYDNVDRENLAKINADGTANTLQEWPWGSAYTLRDVVVQKSTNNPVICFVNSLSYRTYDASWNRTGYELQPRCGVARIDENTVALDPTFDEPGGVGTLTTTNIYDWKAWFNDPDRPEDMLYYPGSNGNPSWGEVTRLFLFPDDTIGIAGTFNAYNSAGIPNGKFAVLNRNGTINQAFLLPVSIPTTINTAVIV
jgi:hypothetical protein